MKQIDYRTAVELMAFSGCTEVKIMVVEVDPIDWNTLYQLNQAGQVLFFVPDDLSLPGSPPKETQKKRKIDRGKVWALHEAGWSNVKIADEIGCSESSISTILSSKEEKKDAD